MNSMLEIFANWNFVLLCVAISCCVFVMRKLIDFWVLDNPRIPLNKQSRVWRELVLPFLPIAISIAFASSPASNSFPYPEVLTTWAGKFLFIVSSGLLSPLVYRVITGLLNNNIQLPENVGGMMPTPINIAPPTNVNIIGATIQDPNAGITPPAVAPAPDNFSGHSHGGETVIIPPSPSTITVEPIVHQDEKK